MSGRLLAVRRTGASESTSILTKTTFEKERFMWLRECEVYLKNDRGITKKRYPCSSMSGLFMICVYVSVCLCLCLCCLCNPWNRTECAGAGEPLRRHLQSLVKHGETKPRKRVKNDTQTIPNKSQEMLLLRHRTRGLPTSGGPPWSVQPVHKVCVCICVG